MHSFISVGWAAAAGYVGHEAGGGGGDSEPVQADSDGGAGGGDLRSDADDREADGQAGDRAVDDAREQRTRELGVSHADGESESGVGGAAELSAAERFSERGTLLKSLVNYLLDDVGELG